MYLIDDALYPIALAAVIVVCCVYVWAIVTAQDAYGIGAPDDEQSAISDQPSATRKENSQSPQPPAQS
jgi:hypothetical protein